MQTNAQALEITEQPPYIGSWSVIGIPGFAHDVINRWQRNYGTLPQQFVMIACPLVEVNATGGLPTRVKELTDARARLLQFTGCHRPYLVILLLGDNANRQREEIQKLLSWSEGYRVERLENKTRLIFIEAVEETEY